MASAVLLVVTPLEGAVLAVGAAVWLPWAACTAFLLALAALALARGRSGTPAAGAAQTRFCILIPAHNEELLLGTVLQRLSGLEYDADLRTVAVVADNCTDGTAEVARSGGALTLERSDPVNRGKGYALEWALRTLLCDERQFGAFVIMDADSVLSADFLTRMDAHLAAGHEAVQARYDVLNADDSWRTRTMTCALGLMHHAKPHGRMALGLSDGLKGNGMCFSRALLERVPWSGESITEDIEYTLRLAAAGVRVHYDPGALVWAQMPTTGGQAATQRERWEGGRYALARRAAGLLWRALRERNLLLADRAAEILQPPLTELVTVPLLGAAAAAAWAALSPGSQAARWALGAWAVLLAAQAAYVALGLWAARVPWKVARVLPMAPAYMAWKLLLYAGMAMRPAAGWNRTDRRRM